MQKLHIYRETKNNNQISDQYMLQPNDFFKVIVNHGSYGDPCHT